MRPRIFLGMPNGSGRPVVGAARGFFEYPSRRFDVVKAARCGASALGQTFNHLWASALMNIGSGVTHFAMLHDDVAPDAWWVDTLYEAMQETGADVVSAVVPIKNNHGLTSTAIGWPKPSWEYVRLTMAEAMELPETFTISDVAADPGSILLVNTGCMLVDLRKPYWRNTDGDGRLEFCFTMQDRITVLKSGDCVVQFWPEDWALSQHVHACGGFVAATRKVAVRHAGGRDYTNDHAWGDMARDEESEQFFQTLREG